MIFWISAYFCFLFDRKGPHHLPPSLSFPSFHFRCVTTEGGKASESSPASASKLCVLIFLFLKTFRSSRKFRTREMPFTKLKAPDLVGLSFLKVAANQALIDRGSVEASSQNRSSAIIARAPPAPRATPALSSGLLSCEPLPRVFTRVRVTGGPE